MTNWNGICQRCDTKAFGYTMSFFNTQLICFKCDEEEESRPDYNLAVQTERAEVMKGNMNYEGIGLRFKSYRR